MRAANKSEKGSPLLPFALAAAFSSLPLSISWEIACEKSVAVDSGSALLLGLCAANALRGVLAAERPTERAFI